MWNMSPNFTYGTTLRDNPVTSVGSGDQCTSADAGGFPMSAFIFSADDIARGSIDHAVRLTLPNSQIRAGSYLRPAVHLGGPSASSTSYAPPYGTRFRLKSNGATSAKIAGFSVGGQVVAKALQIYGMVISDGGDNCLSAFDDTFSTAKWTDADVNLSAINHDIESLTPSDFDVVYGGAAPVKAYATSCSRQQISN
jgi:serine/threonine-protein kinase